MPRATEQFDSAEQAHQAATLMALEAAGVLAWSRFVDFNKDEYGPPEVIFKSGLVPAEME